MATRTQYRKQWMKWHRGYERRAFVIFQRQFKQIGRSLIGIPLEPDTFEQTIAANVFQSQFIQSYVEVYRNIGLLHGKRVGRDINRQIKQFELPIFENRYNQGLIDWILNNAGENITSVRSTFVKSIVDTVSKMFSEGLTTSQVATEIEKLLKGRQFYRWQALRIARTEATAAANYGATVSADTSGLVLVKEWISALDNRTRRIPRDQFDHREMNGVRVDKDELFRVPGKHGDSLMRFPGDPNGRAGAVINCRCTIAMIPKRDANGRLVFA